MEQTPYENPKEINTPSSTTVVDAFGSLLRFIATGIGLFIILVGLLYAMKLFWLIYEGLGTPKAYQSVIQGWAEVLGGKKLDIPFAGNTYSVANVLAIFVLGMGVFLLVMISFSLMKTGAKIVALTSSDREAVKKVLRYTLGFANERPNAFQSAAEVEYRAKQNQKTD